MAPAKGRTAPKVQSAFSAARELLRWWRWALAGILLLVIAAGLIVYGIAIERYQVFPYSWISAAKRSVERQIVDTRQISDCGQDGYCGLLEIGGRLTTATWLDDERIYLADWDGNLWLVNVRTGERRIVTEGLNVPQGLTVLDGRLYVTDMGNVCELISEYGIEGDIAWCKPNGDGYDWADMLKRSSARILSYEIGPTGDLSDRKTVLDRIVSRDHQHGPNGLVNDGVYIYVSIGHPQTAAKHGTGGFVEEMADDIKRSGGRTDLMGTIARFRPDGPSEIEVYARGFRNTYGISIAPDGTIYGADNDQPSKSIPVREELNAIVKNGFYGFPFWGTRDAPPGTGVIEPVAVLEGVGSTMAYASADGVYVAYRYHGPGPHAFVVDLFDYETFTPVRVFTNPKSYITAILEREGLLYLVTFGGYLHVINPAAAPVESKAR